ncbi:MAG TPA: 3-phosphoshikimate 1-carboxyvinyltransferase [Candidatus Hydrogenedentes bacterium]|nr:3-phosphoshikimate 1-carboxyvinyltransferase [Candidatus Hydrogenedentota bacterium]HOL76288.1 3-phosphoshikimate 1-carboxyvinyltransferase [Candidatus Hydrogenedentota bacterium]HPO86115.1 3-phosphoshikimate 1-carboxyvinyltransferase [Candidatus Hydrogenedentota bacterium]
MNLLCGSSALRGEVTIPGSKSHTIRAVAIAALADGESHIERPLESDDARAAVTVYGALGAEIETSNDVWRVQGTGGNLRIPENVLDVGNSGTTLRLAMGSCALLREGLAVLTGDDQIRRRPGGPLAQALTNLGACVQSTRNNGCAPFVVRGRLQGGKTSIEAITSQYLSSLLLNTPLGDNDTVIEVPVLNEQPYVEMTLDWLARQGVVIENENFKRFYVRGGQHYKPVRRAIPADFSSATFFLAAGALPGNDILVRGLDMNDTQGDKAVVDYVKSMGANVQIQPEGIRVAAQDLVGREIDLNATPDALPMLAVLACFARGTTRLVNVPQARLKETDRIAVMREELTKLGGKITELPDGLVIEESRLHSGTVEGHGDHRVIMALAIGATQIPGTTRIRGCEAMSVTYPTFVETVSQLGGNVQVEK